MYYQFTVRINGSGDTLEDAWREATEYFSLDPGSPPMSDEISEYCLLDDNLQPIKHLEPGQFDCENICPKCGGDPNQIDWQTTEHEYYQGGGASRQVGSCGLCGCEFTEHAVSKYCYTEIND